MNAFCGMATLNLTRKHAARVHPSKSGSKSLPHAELRLHPHDDPLRAEVVLELAAEALGFEARLLDLRGRLVLGPGCPLLVVARRPRLPNLVRCVPSDARELAAIVDRLLLGLIDDAAAGEILEVGHHGQAGGLDGLFDGAVAVLYRFIVTLQRYLPVPSAL